MLAWHICSDGCGGNSINTQICCPLHSIAEEINGVQRDEQLNVVAQICPNAKS